MNTMLTDKMVVLLWVFIIAVIFMTTYNKCGKSGSSDDKVEGFYTYPGYYKKYCGSCGWRSRKSCSNCTNCGYCITPSGYGECVPGDSSGPYFREDCQYWEYGDPYDFYPYSHVYPTVKTYNNYPFHRWNLRKGRWGYRKRNLRKRLRNQARETRALRARLKNSQQ